MGTTGHADDDPNKGNTFDVHRTLTNNELIYVMSIASGVYPLHRVDALFVGE